MKGKVGENKGSTMEWGRRTLARKKADAASLKEKFDKLMK
jgi:hypothetical protein